MSKETLDFLSRIIAALGGLLAIYVLYKYHVANGKKVL